MLLKLKKNRKGFTLIELIVVVAIIAILAAIAVPNFIGMQDKARRGVDVANASAVIGVINTYNASQPTSTTFLKDADVADAFNCAAIADMIPVISGGTGAALANWKSNALLFIDYDSAIGIAKLVADPDAVTVVK